MRDCAKFLFNHNPFYPISAALIMVGLREAMQSWGPATAGAWWLAQWLAAYTVLLAVTAVIIIRAGKVWDDARTICLLVVLMFMATSASFDTLCVEAPAAARIILCAGWLFSLGITEWLTRSAGFRFPWLYRGPFYAMLGLFFAFPAVVSSSWWTQWPISDAWRVLGFTTLAGLSWLTLLPAVRRGADYVADNGSPWHWPLYPWSVFFMIAIGVCGRAYLLTLSFQSDLGNQSSFGGYYLVPFALAILIVLAEIAKVHHLPGLSQWMLVAPWSLVLLASIPGTSDAYYNFQSEVTRRLGSPLWLSLIAALGMLLYLGSQKVRNYRAACVPVLLTLVGIGPQTRTLVEFEVQHVWPLGIIVAYQGYLLMRKPTGARFTLAWIMLVVAASIYWRGTAFTRESNILPCHLALLGVWLSCLLFRDDWALYWRRRLPAVWLGLTGVTGLIGLGVRDPQSLKWFVGYLAILGLLAFISWMVLHLKLWKWSMVSTLALICFIGTISATRNLRTNLPPRAVQSLLLGAASFLMGGTISASKAGFTRGMHSRLRQEWESLVAEWHGQATQ